MIGLIVLIVACVMTYNKAQNLKAKAAPYIIAAICLGFLPSIMLHLIVERSILAAVASLFLSTICSFIPYLIMESNERY